MVGLSSAPQQNRQVIPSLCSATLPCWLMSFYFLSWDGKRDAVPLDIVSMFKTRRRKRKAGPTQSLSFISKSTLGRNLRWTHISLARTVSYGHFQLLGKLHTVLFQTKWGFVRKREGLKVGYTAESAMGRREQNNVNNSLCS